MKYEKISPGDGHDYPIVWGWVEDIEGYPIDQSGPGALYLSVDNGTFTSWTFTPEIVTLHERALANIFIVEKLNCTTERAMVFELFMVNKFKEREATALRLGKDMELINANQVTRPNQSNVAQGTDSRPLGKS